MIIKSLLDIKFPDLVLIDWLRNKNYKGKIEFKYDLKCNIDQLKQEFDHVKNLSLSDSETRYLKSIGIFNTLSITDYNVYTEPVITENTITIEGDLYRVIYMKNFIEIVLNDAYYILNYTKEELDRKIMYDPIVYFEQIKRLNKINALFIENSEVRYSFARQKDRFEIVYSNLKNKVLGTSNVKISELLRIENPLLSVSPLLYLYKLDIDSFNLDTSFDTEVVYDQILDGKDSYRFETMIKSKSDINTFLDLIERLDIYTKEYSFIVKCESIELIESIVNIVNSNQIGSNFYFILPKELNSSDICDNTMITSKVWIDGIEIKTGVDTKVKKKLL